MRTALRAVTSVIVLCLACVLPASAQGFTIPPTPDHYVTDNAGALTAQTHAAIENELQAYEKATGRQVVVWIGKTTGGVPLETWTGESADRWKIGRKGHDDGAVLFLFMQDRKIRIEVGYGLESKLTDADSNRIINDDIRPKLRAGDVDGAVAGGVSDMLTTIDPSYKPTSLPAPPQPESSTNGLLAALFILVFAAIFLFVIFTIVMSVVATARYGYLMLREGPQKARKDLGRLGWFVGTAAGGSGSGGGFSFGGGGGGGGFSAGGGSFGGGGASGGW